MRKFTTIMLGSLLAAANCQAYSAELELDNPIAPIQREPEVQPPPTTKSPNPAKDRRERPVRPDIDKKTPSQEKFKEKAPAIDPDAEQINRGAVSPR
ncbi:hypothetical protein LG198_04315 [Methylobacillus arboreus]|uniref:hypothetical protein n=1 Tax=Methylobacillus arboreus TaxID=755170 RepID=UPI001E390422|nr:hypothetical protein [Methylobacillus arboreus]MCB5189951.1 hypothetical protein [Methylobacillus arboreus]